MQGAIKASAYLPAKDKSMEQVEDCFVKQKYNDISDVAFASRW